MKSGFSILELAKNTVKKTREAIPFSTNSQGYFPVTAEQEAENYWQILYVLFRGNLNNRSQNASDKAIYEEIRRKLGVEFLPESIFKSKLNGINSLFPLTICTAAKTFNSLNDLAIYVDQKFKPNKDKKKRNEFEFVEAVAIRALKTRIGNCGENSAYAFLTLMEDIDIDSNVKIKLERCSYKEVPNERRDHAFVILNRTDGNLDDISTWNDDAVICDPWVGQAYTVAEWKRWEQSQDARPSFYILENYPIELTDPFNRTFTHAYVGAKQNAQHGIPIHSDKWMKKHSSTKKPFRPLNLVASEMSADLAAIRKLYQAAKQGDVDTVNHCIQLSKHSIDFPVLMELAIENNHSNLVDYFLKNNYIDLKKDYMWYLQLALANNNEAMFDHLKKTLSFELSPDEQFELLFPLIKNNNLSLLRKFVVDVQGDCLKRGVPNDVESGESTLLEIFANALDVNNPDERNLDIILLLIKKGATCGSSFHEDIFCEKIISLLTKSNKDEITTKLLEIAKLYKISPSYFAKALKVAILNNQISLVDQLLNVGADIHGPSRRGRLGEDDSHDPLPLAATVASTTGNSDILKLLLDRIDVTENKEKIHLALLYAIRLKQEINIDVINTLIEHPKMDINYVPKNTYCGSALYEAVRNGTVECVRLLLNNKSILVNQLCKDYTALHYAAMGGKNDIIKELLKHPDIDCNCIANGRTAMMIAKELGHTESVEILNQYIENKKIKKEANDIPGITQTSLGLFSNTNTSSALINDNTPSVAQSPPQIKKD